MTSNTYCSTGCYTERAFRGALNEDDNSVSNPLAERFRAILRDVEGENNG